MKALIVLGGVLAGLAIPSLLLAVLAKFAALRLYFPGVRWAELTPREALARSKQLSSALAAGVVYLYALAQWIGAGLFFAGLLLFLCGYVPSRFGSG
jgi:hypothetical protein